MHDDTGGKAVTSECHHVTVPSVVFGVLVRSWRARKGVSASAFSRSLGKAPAWLSQLENGFGPKLLPAEVIAALARACGASAEDFERAAAEVVKQMPADGAPWDPLSDADRRMLAAGADPAWVADHISELMRLWANEHVAKKAPMVKVDARETPAGGTWEWVWNEELMRWRHEKRQLVGVGNLGWLVDGDGAPRNEPWETLALMIERGEL